MRKPAYTYTAVTFAMLIAAIILRTLELGTAVDPSTGLAKFLPVSAGLIVLSCVAAVFYLCFAFKAGSKLVCRPYSVSFRPATAIPLTVSVLAMAAMLWAAVLCFSKYRGGSSGIVYAILGVLAFLAAAADVYLKINSFRGKNGRDEFFAMAVCVIFVCYWLIVYYKEHAPVPSLTLTMYDFLGLCAAVTAMYFIAGFGVDSGSASARYTICSCGIAVFFCGIAFIGADGLIPRLFYAFLISKLFIDSELLLCSGDFETAPGTDAAV